MNKSIKKKWVAALRSGEYKQGMFAMCNRGEYCCMGVLCDLLPKPAKKGVYYFRRGQAAELPNAMAMNMAGISSLTVDLLVGQNDNGATFSEIAEYIEARL